MQEEDGEESPLLRSPKLESLPLLPHLEWAEDPELHPTTLPLPRTLARRLIGGGGLTIPGRFEGTLIALTLP
jgi:hypothetical protein